eukprot:758265-Hanusia_phi.AAC.8
MDPHLLELQPCQVHRYVQGDEPSRRVGDVVLTPIDHEHLPTDRLRRSPVDGEVGGGEDRAVFRAAHRNRLQHPLREVGDSRAVADPRVAQP